MGKDEAVWYLFLVFGIWVVKADKTNTTINKGLILDKYIRINGIYWQNDLEMEIREHIVLQLGSTLYLYAVWY
jgi:hypothetical protein